MKTYEIIEILEKKKDTSIPECIVKDMENFLSAYLGKSKIELDNIKPKVKSGNWQTRYAQTLLQMIQVKLSNLENGIKAYAKWLETNVCDEGKTLNRIYEEMIDIGNKEEISKHPQLKKKKSVVEAIEALIEQKTKREKTEEIIETYKEELEKALKNGVSYKDLFSILKEKEGLDISLYTFRKKVKSVLSRK